jgi:hypothetical protein
MEKYAAAHPGTFCFVHLLYGDDSWRPLALEYGVLMPDSLSGFLRRIRDGDRATLGSWTRSPSVSAGVALRARIVLATAAGEGTSEVARRLGVSRPTVIAWRERYRAGGIDALVYPRREGRARAHRGCLDPAGRTDDLRLPQLLEGLPLDQADPLP